MNAYHALIAYVILQRLGELTYSRRNQARLKLRNFEYCESKTAYYQMIALHVAWFAALFFEPQISAKAVPTAVILGGVSVFVFAQVLRIWTLQTLGEHWNTTVMAPNSHVLKTIETSKERTFVDAGPYRLIRHPNYLVVILELASLPVIGGAYFTAIIFSLLNAACLARRIRTEEACLFSRPGYRETMGRKARLLPGLI